MKLIAHRGASGYHPENTLPAFRAALRLGAGELECDLRQTKDGEIVMLHDPDLSRVAGWEARIGDLDFKARPDPGVAPRLAELLAMLDGGVELHLDIKQDDPPYPAFAERILHAICVRPGWRENTTFSSNDAPILRAVRGLDERVRMGFQPGVLPLEDSLTVARELRAESLRLSHRRVTPEWVERIHAAGMEVFVYTIDDCRELDRMESLGVDRVFTDFPDLRKRCLQEQDAY
ncbi:MAG: hypothetical protein A2X36_11745 [Elusimicrobia bacterium GWA2_69_24]|nr:MAG: hypothetical protein A2X36_11745 [Elusimicrobia bacterium GWA2_69_24]HBL17348.1 hypothetical protein [Elusimicrobiota bacterium]